MLQRIQTIYLFIIIVLGIIFLAVPIVAIEENGHLITYNGMDLPYVFILECITILLTLITLLSYKKHKLQIRLSGFCLVLEIGMPVLIWISVYLCEWKVRTCFALPLIQIILNWLALRGIFKDYLTIKSMDRLR